VVRSNKEARKRLTKSNGTPAMDFGCEEIRKRKPSIHKRRIEQTHNHNSNLAAETHTSGAQLYGSPEAPGY